MTGRVVVVGSVNMDVAVRDRSSAPARRDVAGRVDPAQRGRQGRKPGRGRSPAGGAETAIVGAVGADADGDALLGDLSRDGIDVRGSGGSTSTRPASR